MYSGNGGMLTASGATPSQKRQHTHTHTCNRVFFFSIQKIPNAGVTLLYIEMKNIKKNKRIERTIVGKKKNIYENKNI